MASSKKTEREAREARERLRRYTARQQIHEGQLKRRRRDNLFAIGAVLVIAALATVTQIFYFSAGPGMPTAEPSASAEPTTPPGANVGDVPHPSIAEDRTWTGTLQLNGLDLGIELDGAAAPQAVASFVVSTEDGYYQDKTCHRLVVTDTAGLIQCGSFDDLGGTDTSYSFGPIENGVARRRLPGGHDRDGASERQRLQPGPPVLHHVRRLDAAGRHGRRLHDHRSRHERARPAVHDRSRRHHRHRSRAAGRRPDRSRDASLASRSSNTTRTPDAGRGLCSRFGEAIRGAHRRTRTKAKLWQTR